MRFYAGYLRTDAATHCVDGTWPLRLVPPLPGLSFPDDRTVAIDAWLRWATWPWLTFWLRRCCLRRHNNTFAFLATDTFLPAFRCYFWTDIWFATHTPFFTACALPTPAVLPSTDRLVRPIFDYRIPPLCCPRPRTLFQRRCCLTQPGPSTCCGCYASGFKFRSAITITDDSVAVTSLPAPGLTTPRFGSTTFAGGSSRSTTRLTSVCRTTHAIATVADGCGCVVSCAYTGSLCRRHFHFEWTTC